LLLGARCTKKRGCKTRCAASGKVVVKMAVTGSSQREAQQHTGHTSGANLHAANAPRLMSVACPTQPQAMQSLLSSQPCVAVSSMLTHRLQTRKVQKSSSRKTGARARHTSARAERTARRAVGQRLLRSSAQPVAIQLSYDASRLRTKLQLALLAPKHLNSERLQEMRTTAASHTLNDQSVVLMPAYTKSIEVSFPYY